MYFNIEKKFNIEIDNINDPIILIGWPGIALVGKMAVTSIRDFLNAELFMEIEFFDFPPKTTVEDGFLVIPTAKVYYKSRENNDLFILTAEFQPQSSEGVFEFTKKFCEEMNTLTGGRIKDYISTGALVTDKISNNPKVHICSTDKILMEQFLEFENTKLMEGGIIAGANGILPAWAGVKGFAPGICLLAETIPMPMMALDPKASKVLVALLSEFLNIDMDYAELDKKIEETQKIFDSFKKQADYFMKGAQEDKGPDSYFR